MKPSLDPFLGTERQEGWEIPYWTRGWVLFEHLPLKSCLQLRLCQWAQLLPLSCNTMGPSLLCFSNQNALLYVLGLTKQCRRKFLLKSGNQISLTSQSSAKRGFYAPRPSTGLPPVSCLQLGKNLVPQRKANNKSFPSPAGWSPETWDLVTAFHFKRVRNALKPV